MIIVQLPNGSKINVETCRMPQRQVLKVLRAHSSTPGRKPLLAIGQVDKEERDPAGNRVMELKTNAQTKG